MKCSEYTYVYIYIWFVYFFYIVHYIFEFVIAKPHTTYSRWVSVYEMVVAVAAIVDKLNAPPNKAVAGIGDPS